MLSFQIKEEIDRILTAFEDAELLFLGLKNINSLNPELREITDIIFFDDFMSPPINEFRDKLTTVKDTIGVKPRSLFAAIEKFQSDIRQIKASDLTDLSQLNEIDNALESFTHIYESYIDNQNAKNAYVLVEESKTLMSLLNGFKKGLCFYVANVKAATPESEDGKELSIYLSSTLSLAEFILKLQSIERIYKELCMLTDISSPIQILKIESGSLWIKVFGNSKVIDLMTGLVKSGVGFVYRNFTEEGKFSAIPKQIEALESILELRKKLSAEGISVDELDDHINKSAVVVSKALNTLIEGQPEIVINDSKLSIGDEAQKKLIQSNTPLKLGVDDSDINKSS